MDLVPSPLPLFPSALVWLAQGQGTLQTADPPMDDHEQRLERGQGAEGGRTRKKTSNQSKKTGGQRATEEDCSSSLLSKKEGMNDTLALIATRVPVECH